MGELYVGLDLGSRNFEQVVMGIDGVAIKKRRLSTTKANLIKSVEDLRGTVHVHLEAGELAAWTREVLKPLVTSVVVSHSRDNAWIAKDPNKSDRVDALKLADLRRMNRLRPVYYSDDARRRDFKQLVQHYDEMTRQEVKLKLKIKARFRTQGVIAHDRALFTEKGFKTTLGQVTSPLMRRSIEQLYQALCHALERQEDAHKLMLEASARFPEVKVFQAVPGMGPILAACFSGYVQTPTRFSNKRKLWRYCQLGVSHRSSDGTRLSYPRLDRAGNGRLKDVARKAFAAAMRCREDNQFKRAYQRALENTHDPNHARLTVMRKIISVLRAMWLNNSPYQDELG